MSNHPFYVIILVGETMAGVIVHIDLNAFFASVEEIKNPSLKTVPMAVGGKGRRGVISTSNYIARKYGVYSAMPVTMALKLCPNLVLISVSSHLVQ